ncbi:MBL fold metallo-hydrolase [Gordonia jinhuaensis]|uniref:Hydrolase n=1 Tax=Gordonia jinhuaensis TaxID=1517702 RepID=A0A916TF55_9ACTN|nr:MBL fold metallo-hydrolase [Gordonia jinhuaensis]GGB42631.1 hydrolase [Gordonia jinhuaensis]
MTSAVTISDDYTGDVSGSPDAQRRLTPHAEILKLSVGPMDNNVYVVISRASRSALVIDAANDGDRIVALLSELDVIPRVVVTTHKHADHWQGLAQLRSGVAISTAAGSVDAPDIPLDTDRMLDDGDTIELGDLTLQVISLVGHTPGSIALALTDDVTHLFTGDSLFPGGLGKTNSPEDFDSLYTDVTTKLFDVYPDDTIVYPGHGKDTTLGAERPALAQWRERGW